MPFIQTVCGPIEPDQLGFTLMHEHLLGRSLKPGSDPDLTLDSEASAAEDLRHFYTAGGRALVEMSPQDYARDPLAYRRMSKATGVHVICVTGFIKGASLDPFVEGRSVHELADTFIRDVCEGIDETGIRAGVLKAGSSKNAITPNEEKVFHAVAIAHKETGALISTHTEAGTMALEQVALLTKDGVPPERILIGHMDRLMDWEYHLAVVNTGVTLGYDQFAKEKYYPDRLRVEFVKRMCDAGFGGQLALSMDLARRSYFVGYGGGPGFTFMPWRIVPWLREQGVTQEQIETLFVKTPARLLALPS
ncbi:MAG: phosphotriesterase-related protein [Aggregatilineales bacterium]